MRQRVFTGTPLLLGYDKQQVQIQNGNYGLLKEMHAQLRSWCCCYHYTTAATTASSSDSCVDAVGTAAVAVVAGATSIDIFSS